MEKAIEILYEGGTLTCQLISTEECLLCERTRNSLHLFDFQLT